MRLHKHDEIQDEIARAIYDVLYNSGDYNDAAAAALDAMLEAAVRLGVGTVEGLNFPLLILRMEASDGE